MFGFQNQNSKEAYTARDIALMHPASEEVRAIRGKLYSILSATTTRNLSVLVMSKSFFVLVSEDGRNAIFLNHATAGKATVKSKPRPPLHPLRSHSCIMALWMLPG